MTAYRIDIHFENWSFYMKLEDVICVTEEDDVDDPYNKENIEGFMLNLNKLGQFSDCKIDPSKYKLILIKQLPIILQAINGTGYTYNDMKYTIYQDQIKLCKGNTHNSYKQFVLYDVSRNDTAYYYPSNDVDLFIMNGETTTTEQYECLLIFGLK